jgi:hypothetical protein
MKRRQWKPEQKALIVLEGLKGRPIGELGLAGYLALPYGEPDQPRGADGRYRSR